MNDSFSNSDNHNQDGNIHDKPDKGLNAEQYRICRLGGTEPPGSGVLLHEKRDGKFHCVYCGSALFLSSAKYQSGSGWPSFFQPVADERLVKINDYSHGMIRTELRCAECDAHLGHLFPDGPPLTGNRYCINSTSLKFQPADE